MHAVLRHRPFHFTAGRYCAGKSETHVSIWHRLGDVIGSFSQRTGVAGSLANALDPDNWLPGGRDAAFTLALIALSAKMAVSDGVVTASEVRAFKKTVVIPAEIEVQVDWDADVALTREMLADRNCPTQSSIARKGRLLEPLVMGQQTIPAGNAVFMDGSGLYFIES